MSSSIQGSYDNELVENYCRCKSICLKSDFYETVNRKDGVISMCKVCMKEYRKKFLIENNELEEKYQLKSRDKINTRRNEYFKKEDYQILIFF